MRNGSIWKPPGAQSAQPPRASPAINSEIRQKSGVSLVIAVGGSRPTQVGRGSALRKTVLLGAKEPTLVASPNRTAVQGALRRSQAHGPAGAGGARRSLARRSVARRSVARVSMTHVSAGLARVSMAGGNQLNINVGNRVWLRAPAAIASGYIGGIVQEALGGGYVLFLPDGEATLGEAALEIHIDQLMPSNPEKLLQREDMVTHSPTISRERSSVVDSRSLCIASRDCMWVMLQCSLTYINEATILKHLEGRYRMVRPPRGTRGLSAPPSPSETRVNHAARKRCTQPGALSHLPPPPLFAWPSASHYRQGHTYTWAARVLFSLNPHKSRAELFDEATKQR